MIDRLMRILHLRTVATEKYEYYASIIPRFPTESVINSLTGEVKVKACYRAISIKEIGIEAMYADTGCEAFSCC